MDISSLNTRAACLAADVIDPLAHFKDKFALPDSTIYLDGNSLGARPKEARERAQQVLEVEWGEDLIGSWNTHEWFDLPVRIGDKIGQLLGGGRGNTVATDTTSINLFKALAAAIRIQQHDFPERRVIVSERENFPTDLYVAEGMVNFLDANYELRLIDDEESLITALDDDVAVVMLTHVNYRTGKLWDMAEVTENAHSIGALVIWDLCHSAGALPIDLLQSRADFAVGCTYKYLNGGPGSPAFVWIAPHHQERAEQPLSGWWGHTRPFDMAEKYEAAPGARRFLVGTQPILSLATMEVGIDIALSVDESELRAKSVALTSLFIALVEERLAGHPLALITPREEAQRGSHVSFTHPEGFAVIRALNARGVIGDYREPEVMRFGFTPLYLGYADVWDAVEALRIVLEEELWNSDEFKRRGAVT